jgi:hypothetical protein
VALPAGPGRMRVETTLGRRLLGDLTEGHVFSPKSRRIANGKIRGDLTLKRFSNICVGAKCNETSF